MSVYGLTVITSILRMSRVPAVMAIVMIGVYLAQVCLAAACGFVHVDAQMKQDHGAHHGHHPADPASADAPASPLCAWACQVTAHSVLTVEPLGPPVLVAHAAVRPALQFWASEPLSGSLLPRGPPR